MPDLIPIKLPLEIRSSESDIVNFCLGEGRKVKVDFLMPSESERLLRLILNSFEVVRLLDEIAISTEMDTPAVGLVPDNLAYEVNRSAFWTQQSEILKITRPKLRHYRFITGWTCLDVITEATPSFEVIPKVMQHL